MNSIDKNLQFTYEMPDDSHLPFLDTCISIKKTPLQLNIIKNQHIQVLSFPPFHFAQTDIKPTHFYAFSKII